MNITQKDAIALAIALGYKTAKNWTTVRLQGRLNKIVKELDADTVIEPEAANTTLQAVLAATAKDEPVKVIEGDAPETTNTDTEVSTAKKKKRPAKKAEANTEAKSTGTKAKKRPAKKAAASTGEAKAPAKKKVQAEKDAYGNRKGSQAATINEAVSRRKAAFEEQAIADSANLPLARVRLHLKWLVNKGFLTRQDDGKYVAK